MASGKVGVVRFLGTNCDADVKKWLEGQSFQTEYLWYEDRFDIKDYEMVVLPGGFSHGDYLRCGALAARTAVMKSVKEFADSGKPVLGICNGFQILCEARLLPGALLKNKNLKFKDEWVTLKVKNEKTPFSRQLKSEQIIKLPIAHGEGCFYADTDDLKALQDFDQIWLSYEKNPNGSLSDIAGIVNRQGNVCGLMPHPERALATWMGSSDGALFL